jgi:hypothetical protein
MGYIKHDVIVVTGFPKNDFPDIDLFKTQMPSELSHLVIGPILTAINEDYSYCFFPDGSKEGWDISNLGDEWREKFISLFSEGYWDIVSVTFGGDEPENLCAKDNHEYVARVSLRS